MALGPADAPLAGELTLQGATSAAIANRVNTDSAIAIQAPTLPGATVGVIWAGTLPYYGDRAAVDFLGKSDTYISHLREDITAPSAGQG